MGQSYPSCLKLTGQQRLHQPLQGQCLVYGLTLLDRIVVRPVIVNEPVRWPTQKENVSDASRFAIRIGSWLG